VAAITATFLKCGSFQNLNGRQRGNERLLADKTAGQKVNMLLTIV
jgi:hypothetical protein